MVTQKKLAASCGVSMCFMDLCGVLNSLLTQAKGITICSLTD